MDTEQNRRATDPFNLARFVSAQEGVYETALKELQRGRKESHWMWFIFPQMAGLGSSPTAQRYAIHDLNEARAYLAHPVLGPRLLECCRALLPLDGRSASEIMGYPDDLKLRSSMTLFSRMPGAPAEFAQVLSKYFAAEPDEKTIRLLNAGSSH